MTVDEFLNECKRRVRNGKLDFVPATKNRISRRRYGFTILDIEDKILNLNSSDLHRGPEEDRDYPGEYLWIFRKMLLGALFYIKLKLRNNDEVVCISFHKDG